MKQFLFNVNSQPARTDTLKGHEFVFDLIWSVDWDLASSVLHTDYMRELFFDPFRAIDVSNSISSS